MIGTHFLADAFGRVPFSRDRLCTRLCTVTANGARKMDSRLTQVPFISRSSGGRIRTSDLRVMSPTSYQACSTPRSIGRRKNCITMAGPVKVDSRIYRSFKGLRTLLGCGSARMKAWEKGLSIINKSAIRPRGGWRTLKTMS